MALFAFSRHRAEAAQLEKKVTALQVALQQCKGVANQWRDTRYHIIATVAVIAYLGLNKYVTEPVIIRLCSGSIWR